MRTYVSPWKHQINLMSIGEIDIFKDLNKIKKYIISKPEKVNGMFFY